MDNMMERQLERFNMPVLILAGIAIVLYVLELFRLIPEALRMPMIWINFLIDFVFLLDILAKSIILKGKYLKSPWFLIDFVSTMPIISSAMEVMGSVGPQLEATRAARGARVARVARVARTARLATAVRSAQGLGFLNEAEFSENEERQEVLFG
jgi:hypothetical protein